MSNCEKVYIDFTKPGSWKPEDFENPFSQGDANVYQDKWGLAVDSAPFNAQPPNPPAPIGNDHVKWLALSKDKIELDECKCQEVVYETRMAGWQAMNKGELETWVEQNPGLADRITDANSDLRLACSAMNLVDLNSFMVFDFLVTNKVIYAFYERLPFRKTGFYLWNNGEPPLQVPPPPEGLGNYAAFSYAIPAFKRQCDPQCDFHKLAISVNAKKGVVKWFVDDCEVFKVDKIGRRLSKRFAVLDHGGDSTTVKLGKNSDLRYGFGNFNLLDALRPPRDKCDYKKRDDTALVQIDYNENYTTLDKNPLPLDCKWFGINGGCTPGEKSKPTTTDQVAVPAQQRLFGAGAVLRVESLSVHKNDLPWEDCKSSSSSCSSSSSSSSSSDDDCCRKYRDHHYRKSYNNCGYRRH